MKSIFALLLVFSAATAFAQKNEPHFSYSMPGVELGFKWNSADQTNADSNKQEIGFQLGASAVFDLSPSFGLKSGLFYSERPFKSSFPGSVEGKGKVTYFEVPVLLMFKFEEYAGVYVGPSVALKLGDEYTPGSLTDVKSLVVPVTFGAQFKFTPGLGVNVFFETVPGDLANGVSSSRAVGANLLIALD